MSGWAPALRCTNCGRGSPSGGLPFRCPTCSGVYDLADRLRFAEPDPAASGLARFAASLGLPPGAVLPTLGEGGTPLVALTVEGRRVHLKCEHLNPSGSFKDRGSAVLAAALLAAGVRQAIEDSSGNAGASLAAYAARAGLPLRVFVPEYAAGPKQAQIAAYGAELVRVPGPRSQTALAALRAAEAGAVYASHVYLPFGLAGMATVAYELVDQLGGEPGAVILPVGHGTLLLGLDRGFGALREAGAIRRSPQLLGVQARACAPLWAVMQAGAAGLEWVREGETLAEGIRISQPLRGDAVLRAVEGSGGRILAVEEAEIETGRAELARRGLWVEPTSAVVWPALLQALPDLPDPVVMVLTGSGLKAPTGGGDPAGQAVPAAGKTLGGSRGLIGCGG
jgi:threonine synthase